MKLKTDQWRAGWEPSRPLRVRRLQLGCYPARILTLSTSATVFSTSARSPPPRTHRHLTDPLSCTRHAGTGPSRALSAFCRQRRSRSGRFNTRAMLPGVEHQLSAAADACVFSTSAQPLADGNQRTVACTPYMQHGSPGFSSLQKSSPKWSCHHQLNIIPLAVSCAGFSRKTIDC